MSHRLLDTCPINLLNHQKDHVQKIWDILVGEGIFSYLDTSKTGLGKTITTLYLAWNLQQRYNTKVMIVAPSDASLENEDGWLAHAEEFGIKISYATTYSALRGGQGKVSHPWLIPDPENKKKWEASKDFEILCSQGLFLIFDEFHHSKNESITHFACSALVRTAKKHRRVCRVSLLSHTPGDQSKVIPQILRMTGLISARKMFKHIPFTSEYEIEGYGLGELSAVCTKLSPQSKGEIKEMMSRMSKARSTVICKNLYNRHIRSIITFAMPVPKKEFKVTHLNSFFETTPEDLQIVEAGLALLSGAVNWNAANQQVGNANTWNLANIGNGLKLIERGKLATIARYVNSQIKEYPNKKFVISCGERCTDHQKILASMLYRETKPEEYSDIISDLKKKNKDWAKLPKDMINYISTFLPEKKGPNVLNGTVKKDERVKLIKNFQANTNESWCIIISPSVGSESISLQDKHGDHPREMLISPSFMFTKLVQGAGRVDRIGMKSEAKIMLVYSKQANLETSILRSMFAKSRVAKDLIAEGQDVTYPSEYPFWIEGERDLALEFQLNQLH